MERFIAQNRDINSKNLNEFERQLADKVNLKKDSRNAASCNVGTKAPQRYNNNLLNQARSPDL